MFEYLAIRSAKLARGRPYRVLVLLVLVTAVASALLDNVTTVLLIAPVTLLVCDRLGLKPMPFLIAEALASNIGGRPRSSAIRPTSSSPAGRTCRSPTSSCTCRPIVLVILAVFLVLARFLFRGALTGDPARAASLMSLDEKEAITDRRLLVRSSVVLAAILLGFLLQRQTGVAPSVVALVGAGVMILLLSPLKPRDLSSMSSGRRCSSSWGCSSSSAHSCTSVRSSCWRSASRSATGGDVAPTLMVVLVGSAVVSAVVDNIPYVTAMTPVVESLIASNPALGEDGALWWALALGADLGGNATLVGASANVVIVGIAARNGLHISFMTWLQYGVPTAVMSIALCIPYVVLRYGSRPPPPAVRSRDVRIARLSLTALDCPDPLELAAFSHSAITGWPLDAPPRRRSRPCRRCGGCRCAVMAARRSPSSGCPTTGPRRGRAARRHSSSTWTSTVPRPSTPRKHRSWPSAPARRRSNPVRTSASSWTRSATPSASRRPGDRRAAVAADRRRRHHGACCGRRRSSGSAPAGESLSARGPSRLAGC